MKLHAVNIGIALGAISALWVFALGIMAGSLNWGGEVVYVLGSLYPGYDPTLLGSFFGAVWVFVDCFIAGFLFAWIYNRLPQK